MSASHSRSASDQHHGSEQYLMGWEKHVLLGLMKVCMESSTGQSSIDSLRDVLIERFPQVLPDLKQKYGKFTALLKAHAQYFQINPFDRTVKLMAIHPDILSPSSSYSDRGYAPNSLDTSNSSSSIYSNASSSRDMSSYSDRTYSTSSASSTYSGSRSRSAFAQPSSMSTSPDISVSPRSHVSTVGRRASVQPFSSFHGPTSSASGSSLPANNSNLAHQSNQVPKHVSFSSLEQWEQMIVFAVLKHLLHTTSGFEHYTTLQDRLNDPQLLSKYVSLLDLLRLFPGNFIIDIKGYVSLLDPAKARLQYPTLAAEFERRITTPQAPTIDPTSHLTVAFNNATSPWEKALLKTVWTLLMAQANHAANFPWLTTQLTRFKPWVKQNFGSLRLWAIQQTLFKFQGDTIYIPAHVAPSGSASGMNATATGTMGATIPGPPPPAPPTHRNLTAGSSFAPVSSANFSIPVPPALPQRRASTNTSQPAPPAPLPTSIAPKGFQPWGDMRDNWGFGTEDMSARVRGRQPVNAPPPGHKRQRSASPSSIRQLGGVAPSSSSHHRSQSNTMDDMGQLPPVRFGYGPPASNPANNVAAPVATLPSAVAAPVNIPKLNFQASSPLSSATASGAATSHPFLRKTSTSLDNTRPDHMGGTSSAASTGLNAFGAPKEKETVILAAQPLSPRRLAPHPLHSIDKEIPSLSQVPLVVNRVNVAVKVVQSIEEIRKAVAFLSTFSCISVSVETGEFESRASQRRSKMSQDIIHSPTDDTSQSSAKSVRIASSPSASESPDTSSLVIGSAPSHATANPLESQTSATSLSQDDSIVGNSRLRNGNSRYSEGHSIIPEHNESSSRHVGRSLDEGEIPIIHEGREDSSFSNTTKDIVLMCLSARTTHGHSPHAPSSTLAGHSDKDLFKSHPVFVFDLRQYPKFYRYLRPLLQSTSTLKIVYNCPSLADLLYTQHGIHLTNIIEIQVLHRLLWEITSLPTRFTQATGLETSLNSDEISSKNSESHSAPKGVPIGGGHTHLSESTGSAKSGSLGIGTHTSGGHAKGYGGSTSTALKSPPNASDRHSAALSGSSGSGNQLHVSHAGTHHQHASGTQHHNTSQYPAQPPIPAMDAPLGQLLEYFGIILGGLPVPEKHPLLDAVENNISGASIRSALWPAFSISPASLLRIVAVCATLIDLRILLATQLSVSFSKTALQLSQGYSHTHLPEFQNNYATGTTLTPMSQDQWMDAPELFSHLNEGHY